MKWSDINSSHNGLVVEVIDPSPLGSTIRDLSRSRRTLGYIRCENVGDVSVLSGQDGMSVHIFPEWYEVEIVR